MKQWKRRLRNLMFLWWFLSPWFVVVYGLAWYRFSKLCRYGNIRKNASILFFCLVFFVVYFISFGVEVYLYRKNSSHQVRGELWLSQNQVKLSDGMEFDYNEIRWYRRKQNDIYLFLKGHRFVWINTEDFLDKNREYIEIMLTQRGLLATHFWRLPMLILIGIITVAGGLHVGKSAQPYEGKLPWILQELEHRRSVPFTHDNIFEDGLNGILADIRSKVELPEDLYLENSFNLHFAADGTVLSLDTFVCGYDRQEDFGGTYLISYDAKKSNKIEIYVNKFEQEPILDQVEDLDPLLQGMRVIPLRDTVKEWKQDTYGILYYGLRNWGYNTEGICYISSDGTITKPSHAVTEEIQGFSISVFCPEDESIPPVRYIYQGVL